ncbi:MAG: magnesium transporter CorA family protein, partial [Saprospiraceae bacterium]|nr:magnesium transporter CorA family protein [Saprospiraceae bacterium]
MIRYYTREKRRLVELDELEPGCWVHLTPPFTPDELEDIARRFEFDAVFLTDSLDLDERARYERDEDIRFILINTPVKNRNGQGENEAYFITVPIGVILTIEHVITISAFETPILDKFLENNVRNFNPADEKRFVLQVLEQNVYHFLSCLKTLNLRRNRIEK